VGITLTVTPRINEKKFVVMEIKQTIDNISGVQTINDTDWPVVTTRKLEADIAVKSGETIVMGGLVQTRNREGKSKVPGLGNIPVLGIPFRSSRQEKSRNEVIVFITPYVLDTPEEISADARRRLDSMQTEGMWQRGWSDSKYAEDPKGQRQALDADGTPLDSFGPELIKDINRVDKRWGQVLEKADDKVEREIGENENP
jgi:general secretion pathway protein D